MPRCDAWSRYADLDFSRALAARGLLGLTWPVPYGRGASQVERLAVTEELLRAGAPVAAHWIGDRQIGPALLRHGLPGACIDGSTAPIGDAFAGYAIGSISACNDAAAERGVTMGMAVKTAATLLMNAERP